MKETRLQNLIDCTDLTVGEINSKVNDLFLQKYKQIVMQNTSGIKGLLEGINAPLKIELLEGASDRFAHQVAGVKLIVNGHIGDGSANNSKFSKYTVFGSCGENFGLGSVDSEFYIFGNCGVNAFSSNVSRIKAVIGGKPGPSFARGMIDSTLVILNLKGGKLFIDDDWLEKSKNVSVYLRGNPQVSNKFFKLTEVSEDDEDIYLPLISEFARLLKCSLSEIKSIPFFKVLNTEC